MNYVSTIFIAFVGAWCIWRERHKRDWVTWVGIVMYAIFLGVSLVTVISEVMR